MASLWPPLLAALDQVTVAADLGSARVADRRISAASPTELTHRLSRAIYETFHVGWPQEPADRSRTGKDDHLEGELLAATPHRSVCRAARLVSADAELVRVELDGVRVSIPREAVQLDADQQDGVVTVALPSYRPVLSPGYWLADGTRPLADHDCVLRGYVHLSTPGAVVAAWQSVLGLLEDLGVGYRAKVTSLPALLPRRDALVVYLAGTELDAVAALAACTAEIDGLGREVPVFAEEVGSGVAIAYEPADPRPTMRGLSFGEHRARAVADGLVRHAGRQSGGSAAEAVSEALLAAGVDAARTARNLRR